MKRNNHFSSTCIWKITIPRSAYRASEMLIIFNECARYRSIRRMKNIAKNSSSQRILLPAIPLLRRSSPLQFNENFFSAQRNPRFFLLDNLEALPIYVLKIHKVHFATRRRGNILCWFSGQVAPHLFQKSKRRCIPFEKFFPFFVLFYFTSLYLDVLNLDERTL